NAVGLGADCGCSLKYKELSDAVKAFTVAALNNNDKKFLGSLPIKEHVEINSPISPFNKGGLGGIKFLLSHGSPNGDMYKYLSPDVSDSELLSELGDENADFAMPCRHDVVFIGHTHLPMIRKVGRITIVNPGSVGQPRDGIPLCSYAVWDDGNIEIKRVEYDIDAAINAYEATSISKQHIKTLSQILKTGGRF
ncbi:MAG: metallophosphoesterase family protein, partial [Candidatus Brocadiales bacterium]